MALWSHTLERLRFYPSPQFITIVINFSLPNGLGKKKETLETHEACLELVQKEGGGRVWRRQGMRPGTFLDTLMYRGRKQEPHWLASRGTGAAGCNLRESWEGCIL